MGDHFSIIKTTKIKSDWIHQFSQTIANGISEFIRNPLILHSKRKSLANKSNNFLIGIHENKPIGFLMYRIIKDECILYEIHIQKEFKYNRYGTQLMNEFIKDQPEKPLVLFVHKKNISAQKFYKKFGFVFQDDYVHKHYYEMVRDKEEV